MPGPCSANRVSRHIVPVSVPLPGDTLTLQTGDMIKLISTAGQGRKGQKLAVRNNGGGGSGELCNGY